MKKIIIAIIPTLTLILITIYIYKPYYFDKIITPVKKNVNCVEYEKKNYHLKLKDGQGSYIKSASRNGISKCDNKNDLLKNSKLIKIENSKFFIIDNLTHSYPYLTEDGRNLLNKIGRGFNLKISNSDLEDTKFIVTSLTRTTESINRLQKSGNKNSNKQRAHLYGECIDITYKRFSNRFVNLKPCHLNYLKEVLAGVLYDLKKNKKCWAITEKRQPCFHVVCR